MPTIQTANNSQNNFNAPDVLFKVGKAQEESHLFAVGETPKRITLWLPADVGDDEVIFYRVLQGDASCIVSTGCCISTVGGVQEIARLPHKICSCTPRLNKDCRSLVIIESGRYQAVLQKSDGTQAANITQVLVMIEDEGAKEITLGMRGCCA